MLCCFYGCFWVTKYEIVIFVDVFVATQLQKKQHRSASSSLVASVGQQKQHYAIGASVCFRMTTEATLCFVADVVACA